MTEPDGWTTPQGWGPPTPPQAPAAPAPPPAYGDAAYGGPPPSGPTDHRPYGQVAARPGVVPLRPLGLGELLDGAVGVLRRYPRPTLGMSAAVAVLATLVNVVLLLTAFRPFLDVDAADPLVDGDAAALEAALGGAAVGGLLTAVLTLLSTAVLTGVLTAVVGKAVLGQPFSLRAAWETVRPLLLKLVAVALLLALIAGATAFGFVLLGAVAIALGGNALLIVGVPLIVGGFAAAVYLYVRYSLAPCALVLEKVGIVESLRRSAVLVKGDWWRVFGISALTFVVALFVSLVIQVPFEFLGYGSFGELAGGGDALSARTLVLSSIGGIVASTLVEPFTAGVRALLYVDRRMRAEGLDVALAAAADQR